MLLFALYPARAVYASNEVFVGTWKGEGTIIVTWCAQKQMPFELNIDEHGTVSGTIGDATIQYGTMELNNILYRWLGNREYIIDAELSGYLIEKENIKRDSIRIFLDFEKPFLSGGFHSSGSTFGGKEEMVLSGSSVKLVKVTE